MHLLDCYHILKNVRKHLKDRSLLKNLSQLVHARTKSEYSKLLKDCYDAAEDDDVDSIARFDRNREQYCFSHAPLTMFGFSASDSINEKTNDMMKTVIPRSRPLSDVLSRILKFLEELGAKADVPKIEKTKVEKIFGCLEVKEIRCMLHEKVFGEFVKELGKLNLMEIMHWERDFSQAIILDSNKT